MKTDDFKFQFIIKTVLTVTLVLFTLLSFSQKQALNTFLSGSSMKNASVSFLAVDLSTGDTIIQHRSSLSLCPASVTKIITTSTALELFGPEHCFTTEIAYSGKIVGGELNGDLIIKGGGDPALGSSNFSYYDGFAEKWAEAVVAAGIKKVNGAIISDISYFNINNVPDGWTWGDIGNYFGAAPLSLNVYDNEFTVTFNTQNSGKLTRVVSIKPEIPYMNFVNHVKAGNVSGDNSMIYGSVNDRTRTAEGLLPAGRSEFEVRGAIPEPPLLLAMELQKSLSLKGVFADTCYYKESPDSVNTTSVFKYKSVPLKEIVSITNLKSMNLYAEVLFRQSGLELNKEVVNPADIISGFWSGKINTEGFFIEDGCGLSRSNAFSAGNLVSLLSYMKKSKNFDAFYESLPVAGKTGTISGMFNGTVAEGNLRAKSGSLNRVRCYAGYLTTKTGKEVAFAILVNNFGCTQSEIKNRIEKLLISLY